MEPIDRLFGTLEVEGGARYGMEAINQLEHALQSALQAEQEDAGPALITAALLHDIGHLIHKLGVAAELGIDDRHEVLGEKLLRRWFDDDVVLPVALHVDAKRYLCRVEPGYFDRLSPASVRSLELQGGPFRDGEADEFIRQLGGEAAVRLRRWDERAKVKDLETPPLSHFCHYVEACIRPGAVAAE
ncbi:MAG: HD domain-containing protein [Rhodospirillaceae bacterium]|nr:phosphohydrolase [Rhodospirillaceae bacterium]RZO34627.1 MAG: HD domain-containing protein [Rhodospirillaceae bacterium]